MSGSSNPDFNVGIDEKLVLILGVLGRIDFSHVTGWEADPITKEITVERLYGPPLGVYLPGGWKGSFDIDRANSVADDTWAVIETMYYGGQRIPRGTLYQYVNETNGSISTYQFSNVAIGLAKGGKAVAMQPIKQTISFWSSERTRM